MSIIIVLKILALVILIICIMFSMKDTNNNNNSRIISKIRLINNHFNHRDIHLSAAIQLAILLIILTAHQQQQHNINNNLKPISKLQWLHLLLRWFLLLLILTLIKNINKSSLSCYKHPRFKYHVLLQLSNKEEIYSSRISFERKTKNTVLWGEKINKLKITKLY